MYIAVKPEKLDDLSSRLKKMSGSLQDIESKLQRSLNRLDWETRQKPGIQGNWNRAQKLAQSNISEAESMASFLVRQANAFREADRQGVNSLANLGGRFASFVEKIMNSPFGALICFPFSSFIGLINMGGYMTGSPKTNTAPFTLPKVGSEIAVTLSTALPIAAAVVCTPGILQLILGPRYAVISNIIGKMRKEFQAFWDGTKSAEAAVLPPKAATDKPGVKADEDTTKGTGNAIIDRLINDTSLGLSQDKKNTMIYIADILLKEGYDSRFIAGVLANILAEGTFGLFESSAYISNPSAEPAYLKHVDKYYNYRTEFSGKNIMQVGVEKTKNLIDALVNEDRNNDGKLDRQIGSFGFGSVQWTWGRTLGVIDCYIEVCGLKSFPTQEQCQKAEGLFIVKELNGDYYNKRVYQKWKSQYSNSNELDAVYGAGSIVCLEYEKPKYMNKKAVERGNNANKIYNVMMGNE